MRVLALLGVFILLASCVSGEDAGATYAASEVSALSRASTATVARVPLAGWLVDRPRTGSGTLQSMPVIGFRDMYVRTIEAMVASDWPNAEAMAKTYNFEIVYVSEGDNWFAVLQPFELNGIHPLVVVNPNATKQLIAEAPHASLERGTISQAAMFLSHLGGRAAIIAGAHRCAAVEKTSCSGKTRVCGTDERSTYPVSDVAHATENLFHIAHETLAASFPEAIVFSLHGMRDRGETDLIISDGSLRKVPVDEGLSGKLRDALRLKLPGTDEQVVSCHDNGDNQKFGFVRLCGSTNVQGRHINDSPDACSQSTANATGHFLHLEQTWTLLGEFERGWGDIEAYPNASALLSGIEELVPNVSK